MKKYIGSLQNKITEEKDRTKLIYEFADLLEAIQTLADVIGIKESEITEAQTEKKWRTERDSNSRKSYPFAGFQDRCLKPLGHLSFYLQF